MVKTFQGKETCKRQHTQAASKVPKQCVQHRQQGHVRKLSRAHKGKEARVTCHAERGRDAGAPEKRQVGHHCEVYIYIYIQKTLPGDSNRVWCDNIYICIYVENAGFRLKAKGALKGNGEEC